MLRNWQVGGSNPPLGTRGDKMKNKDGIENIYSYVALCAPCVHYKWKDDCNDCEFVPEKYRSIVKKLAEERGYRETEDFIEFGLDI